MPLDSHVTILSINSKLIRTDEIIIILTCQFYQAVTVCRLCLSTLPLHHETLGLLVTQDVAGHADAQELVLGGILELVPLFGEVSTVDGIRSY